MFEQLTDEQIRDAEQQLTAQKRERQHVKWDAELVGRYFRVICTPMPNDSWPYKRTPLGVDDFVTLERSLAVGLGHSEFVYADLVFIHIQRRDDSTLMCSGFQVSHVDREEPYLKIQPAFYSYDDFRNYLNSWTTHSGRVKHCDEVSKDEYEAALTDAVKSFTRARQG